MTTNHIIIRPDRLNFPLATCNVGRLSSAVLTIGGEIPADIDGLAVQIEYTDATANPPATARYTAAATRQADGSFRCYLAPAYFPAASNALKYHVIATDAEGAPRWLGTGNLRILDNPANGSAVAPDILPRNLYAYSPSRNCYYKVIAKENEYGEITLDVDETEVQP